MTITDPITLLIASFLVLFALMLVGVPIAISLAVVGTVGFFIFQSDASLVSLLPFRTLDSFILTAIPLFVFMGEILVKCGASELIYRGASRLLSWLPGGLWHSNIGACAMFAAISGSSPATAATIGTVAIPSLKTRGYDTCITLGSLAAGGTLGILIPPSINMIVYGVVAEQSIGRLFAAGVIPGVILAGLFMFSIILRVLMKKNLAPRETAFSLRNLGLSFIDLWPLYVLAVIVLGGIFGGYMTPTEAAAVGACTSLIMAIILRRFNWEMLKSSLASSVETTCMVLFIVVGSSIMASFFSRAGIPQAVTGMIIGAGVSKWAVLAYICIIYLFLGCFMDIFGAIILTVPIIMPTVNALGINPIWFGVIIVRLMEIGLITPPLGMDVFTFSGAMKLPTGTVFRGIAPFVAVDFIHVALLLFIPELSLFLTR